jgi:hypothetical protein
VTGERVEMRLIGKPDAVNAAMAVLLHTPGLRVVPTGRDDARHVPGCVRQYAKINVTAVAPNSGGAQPPPTPPDRP